MQYEKKNSFAQISNAMSIILLINKRIYQIFETIVSNN